MNAALAELKQHIKGLERGLATWRQQTETRIAAIENDVTVIKGLLAARLRAEESDSEPEALSHEGQEADPPSLDPQYAAGRLGLTRGQSRVAVMLAEGRSVSEIAAVMGRKVGTIRYYIKQLHRRLGTRRQTQLVRAVLLADYGRPGSRAPSLDVMPTGK